MLAALATRRSLAVVTSLNAVNPQLVLTAGYAVAKGGKPAPKAIQPPAKKATPPPPPAKKSTPPPPAAKKGTPPPPTKATPTGSKGSQIAAERAKAQQEKEKEKEKKDLEAQRQKEKEKKEAEKAKLQSQKEKEKEKAQKEKEKEKAQKDKEKEKAQKDKQKEKEKEQKEKDKEQAAKEKAKEQKQKAKEKEQAAKEEQAEKKKEEKAKKDAMPTRARSAYIIFATEVRPLVVKEKPNLAVTEVLGEVAKRWTALSADKRDKYEKASAQDKVRFEKELKEFKKKYPDPPKRALSAFSIYVKENFPILKKAKPEGTLTEITGQLAKQWNALPADKKQKYEALHEQEKSKYLKEKEKFDKQQAR